MSILFSWRQGRSLPWPRSLDREELMGCTVSKWSESVSQSCLTVCDPMSCLPTSSVRGIPQERLWVMVPFSKGSSWPRDETQLFCFAGRFFTLCATREALRCTSLVVCNLWSSRCPMSAFLLSNMETPPLCFPWQMEWLCSETFRTYKMPGVESGVTVYIGNDLKPVICSVNGFEWLFRKCIL